MLETKFKVALLLVVLAAASLPIMGIIQGTIFTPYEREATYVANTEHVDAESGSNDVPIADQMVLIPAGPFIRGTDQGGLTNSPSGR